MNIQDFYTRYPKMVPYVGESYELAKKNSCALLVIGESHFLPAHSTIHKDSSFWYNSNDSCLNNEERVWISTSDIIAEELRKEKAFSNKSHIIFMNGLKQINAYGPRFSDYCFCFKYIVFYNYYLRPANESNSFRELLTAYDNEVANDYFAQMVEKFSPNGIVFLSTLAYDCCNVKNNLSIPIARAPHPGCAWWNRKSTKYGNRYGRDVVEDGLRGINWEPIRILHGGENSKQ